MKFTNSRRNWRAIFAAFNGPQTIGESRSFWISMLAVLLFAFTYPLWGAPYFVSNAGYLMVWIFLGLSVCILWGYTGVFSFGQTAFFGLAGYAYGVVAINLLPLGGGTGLAVLIAIVAVMLIAAVLGYIMFYGGVSSLYVAIFTLMMTLLAETVMSRTSGPRFQIGGASLGGSNGMVGIPPISVGFGGWSITFTGAAFYYLVLVLLIATYLGLRLLLNSDRGYLMVATREDALRTQMFGYDTRRVQLTTFIFAAGLAGLSGVLYASWNNFIAPSSMGMTAATLPIIWVAAGGRKSILAVIIATFFLQWMNQELAYAGGQYSLMFFALLILATVLIFPEGAVPKIVEVTVALRRRMRIRRGDARAERG